MAEQDSDAISGWMMWVTRVLVLVPWLAAALSVFALVKDGFPLGHDWGFELIRISEYANALAVGQWPPYWADNLYGGYGSPIFLFYAPLFMALSAPWVSALGLSAAAVVSLVLLTIVSLLAMQHMLRAAGATPAGVRIGTTLYVLAPYLLTNKLTRNANAEFAGLCVAPLALAGLFMLRERPRSGALWIAFGLSLTILAHNLTALIIMGLLIVGAIVLYAPLDIAKVGPPLAIGIGIALLATAWFWMPAVGLGEWMRREELLTGKFDFRNQFSGWSELFGRERFYGSGLLPIAVGIAAAVALVLENSKKRQRLLAGALVGALAFIFLMRPASVFIWESFPFLPLFQFPWRMMGPFSLLVALAAALAFGPLLRGRPRALWISAEIVVLALCVANAWPRLDDYQPMNVQAREYIKSAIGPDATRYDRQRVTVGDEYLPAHAKQNTWTRLRPQKGPVARAKPAPHDVLVVENNGTRIELIVDTPAPTRLRLARWNFEGWSASIGGDTVPVEANPLGSIDVHVPAGRSQLKVELSPPKIRRIGMVLGLMGAVLLLGVLSGRPRALWRAKV